MARSDRSLRDLQPMQNIAESLDETERKRIGGQVVEQYELDKATEPEKKGTAMKRFIFILFILPLFVLGCTAQDEADADLMREAGECFEALAIGRGDLCNFD